MDEANGIRQLVEIAFFASLCTEESQPIKCRLAFADPKKPNPTGPSKTQSDGWSIFCLENSLPLTVENLVKIAAGTPTYASEILVYTDSNGQPIIWGLADQIIHYQSFMNRETEKAFHRPGFFQIEICGIGELQVFRKTEVIATLRHGAVRDRYLNPLLSGPILKRLIKYYSSCANKAAHIASDKDKKIFQRQRQRLLREAIQFWISALSRILTGIRRQRHGGALLLTPRVRENDILKIKYKIQTSKLEDLISKYVASRCMRDFYKGRISSRGGPIPASLYNNAEVNHSEAERSNEEISGLINLIIGLSRVDGLILMEKGLNLAGFGVEIRSLEEPESVYIAADAEGISDNLQEIPVSHYGTRHRSMFRYCYSHPAAVGFVISQDGDIRAVTRVEDRVVMWNNIKLSGPIGGS